MPDQIINLDSDQLVFFRRQLEYIKSKSYDIKYPMLQATQLFPVSTEAGAGAETITYEQFDSVGVMKFIADYADDLPRSDVKGRQFSIIVQSLGGSYGYSVQEIRSAEMANRNLNAMRANSARRSNDQMANRIGFFADGSSNWAGLTGILYHPNTTKVGAPTGDWLNPATTPDQIIADVNAGINGVSTLTNGVEMVDTVVLPIAMYAHIATRPRSATSDTTILEFLRRVHPQVTFVQVPEMANVNPNPRTGAPVATNCALYYRRSPDHIQYEIPVIYEQFSAQEKNLAVVVPVHSRNGGLNVYYPLSVLQQDGL